MEAFLEARRGAKSNREALKETGLTLKEVRRYSAEDRKRGGDFGMRWQGAVGASAATPLTQKVQDNYHAIFEAGGELDRIQDYLTEIPMYARFVVERGRRLVIETAHEPGEDGPQGDPPGTEEVARFYYWGINPEWQEARQFAGKYLLRDMTPKLGMALVQHVGKTDVDVDMATLGDQIFQRIVGELDARRKAEEFQKQQVAEYERLSEGETKAAGQ